MRKFKREMQRLGDEYNCNLGKAGKKNSHLCFTHRVTGRKCFFSATSSDWRAVHRLRQKLKRLNLPS